MDGKLAVLYSIIIAMITFLYVDRPIKHAITSQVVARIQAAAE